LGDVNVGFDIRRRDLIFSFVGMHIVDSGASSAVSGKVTHLPAVEAWSFRLVCTVGQFELCGFHLRSYHPHCVG
jgi:hypothetical protein